MPHAPKGVLFLCVANSARSQMAEGLARAILPEHVAVFSAGSEPATLNPYAVRAMAEIDLDIREHFSKAVSDLPVERIDLAITLCAEEVCPVFAHDVEKLHWAHPDPADAQGEDDAVLASFRTVRDAIRAKLIAFRGERYPA